MSNILVVINCLDGTITFELVSTFLDSAISELKINNKEVVANLGQTNYLSGLSKDNPTLNISLNMNIDDVGILLFYSYKNDTQLYGKFDILENSLSCDTKIYCHNDNKINEYLLNLQIIRDSQTQPIETTPQPTITPIISNNFDDTKMIDKLNQIHISNVALTISICFYVVYRIAKNILQ